MHDALQCYGPVGPVGATLAVHHIRRAQRPICAQLGSAPVNERSIPKDDLISIPWRHPCKRASRLAHCSSAGDLSDVLVTNPEAEQGAGFVCRLETFTTLIRMITWSGLDV